MKLAALILSCLMYFLAVHPLQIHRKWKMLLAVPVLLAGFKSQLLHLFGGPFFFAPDLPGAVIAAAAWVYAVFMLYLLILIPAGIIRGLWMAVLKIRKKEITYSFRKKWNTLHAVLLILMVITASFGLSRGTMIPEIRDVKVVIPGKEQKQNLKIVLLADIHADRMTGAEKVRKFVEKANEADGDVIVISGDLFDGVKMLNELLPLKDLRAPDGVYAVPGNHEYYSGYGEWKKFTAEELPNIRILENESVILRDGTVLAGVTDPAASRKGKEAPDVRKALAGAPEASRKILLAHQPKLAPEAAECGADLTLAGHTHGGMVIGMDFFVKLMNKGFLSGLYEVDGRKLYVSNGTGIWNGFPVRLGYDPEITRITVSAGE